MYRVVAQSVELGGLPDGRAGVKRTLELMRGLVRKGATDPVVRHTAIATVKRDGVKGRDYAGELRSLFRLARDGIRYTRDVHGVETLQAPALTLSLAAGDCDDKSILLAALLRSIGHPAELAFRAIGSDRSNPSKFGHVYVVARIGGKRIPLDPTVPQDPGWEFPTPTVAMELPA